MQTQHLIIIAACSAVGLLLMAYFVRQAVLRAIARGVAAQSKYHQERVAGLTKDIIRLSQTPQAESILTWADYQTLLQAHATLILAQMTWRAMPGTESTQLKAEKQAQRLLDLANRISTTAKPGAAA
ncbi:hypothetical protein [Pseudomonas moorei]|uniref:hypothetical protein n=1 Tax=Pseudomonas moorei TaxID=395599 RepID=UPI0036F19EAF